MDANIGRIARRSLMGLALAGSLCAGIWIQNGFAEDLNKDMRHDQHKLRHDVQRHGTYSRQAQRDRADLRQDYQERRSRQYGYNSPYNNTYNNGWYGNGTYNNGRYNNGWYNNGYRNGQWRRHHRRDGDHDRDDR